MNVNEFMNDVQTITKYTGEGRNGDTPVGTVTLNDETLAVFAKYNVDVPAAGKPFNK